MIVNGRLFIGVHPIYTEKYVRRVSMVDYSQELYGIADKYQKFTMTTAVYPGRGKKNKDELLYLFLGLAGEEREWYDSGYDIKEAGDIFWYMSQLCTYLDISFADLIALSKPAQKVRVNIHEHLKKFLRDGKDVSDAMLDYISDTLNMIIYRYHWSINNPPIDETLKLIIMKNMDKLTDRQNRNMLHGDGDNR